MSTDYKESLQKYKDLLKEEIEAHNKTKQKLNNFKDDRRCYSYRDVILSSNGLTTSRQIAEDYACNLEAFLNILVDTELAFRDKDNNILLNLPFASQGYAVPEPYNRRVKGKVSRRYVPSWTKVGWHFLYEYLAERGYRPCKETLYGK